MIDEAYLNTKTKYLMGSIRCVGKPGNYAQSPKIVWPYHIGPQVISNKSLKSSQIWEPTWPIFTGLVTICLL